MLPVFVSLFFFPLIFTYYFDFIKSFLAHFVPKLEKLHHFVRITDLETVMKVPLSLRKSSHQI